MHEKNPAAVALGRLGGIARAEALPEKRRKEIAASAAQVRWYARGEESMKMLLLAVKRGELSVDEEGRVWAHRSRGERCEPRRTDHSNGFQSSGSAGYLMVHWHVEGQRYRVQAHRLIWTVLRGAIPEGLQINHIDGDVRNNALVNLEVVTGKENQRHSRAVLKTPRPDPPRKAGEDHNMAKLTWEKVREIRRLRKGGASTKELMAQFEIKNSQVLRIVNRQCWIE